jgi:hypothetical protein
MFPVPGCSHLWRRTLRCVLLTCSLRHKWRVHHRQCEATDTLTFLLPHQRSCPVQNRSALWPSRSATTFCRCQFRSFLWCAAGKHYKRQSTNECTKNKYQGPLSRKRRPTWCHELPAMLGSWLHHIAPLRFAHRQLRCQPFYSNEQGEYPLGGDLRLPQNVLRSDMQKSR